MWDEPSYFAEPPKNEGIFETAACSQDERLWLPNCWFSLESIVLNHHRIIFCLPSEQNGFSPLCASEAVKQAVM